MIYNNKGNFDNQNSYPQKSNQSQSPTISDPMDPSALMMRQLTENLLSPSRNRNEDSESDDEVNIDDNADEEIHRHHPQLVPQSSPLIPSNRMQGRNI